MDITSRTNPLIVEAVKLNNKKYRDLSHMFCFEGIKLFREAKKRGVRLMRVFVTEDAADRLSGETDIPGCETFTVSGPVYDKLTGDKAPDGVFCVARELPEVRNGGAVSGRAMILCDIQDAGNLGTCIRSALAFGIDTLILAGDCADVYNKKCVRSSMGALFSQKILRIADPVEAAKLCRASGLRVYAAALKDGAVPLDELEHGPDVAFAVGNEGHGLSDEFIAACDGTVIIPMSGDTESLNAAIASSILMWETARRK